MLIQQRVSRAAAASPDVVPFCARRRDIVWAIMSAEGYVYDLDRQMIAEIFPRPDVFPILALGLEAHREPREGRLWRRGLDAMPTVARVKSPPPPTPPAFTRGRRAGALALLRSGQSLRKVAAQFPGVSSGATWRLTQSGAGQDGVEPREDEEGE